MLGLSLTLALIAGCSYSSSEPGMFSTPPAAERTGPPLDFPTPNSAPGPANPRLPVAGDVVWTSSEGVRLTSRFAVHAVRRMAGATILDWSITPLFAPGLEPGELVPSAVDLGLGRTTGGDVNALLLDAAGQRAYRPLQHRDRRQFNHCLCTPPWVVRLSLRIGETRLLQIAFPELPAGTRSVDVSFATLPLFTGVPVTPAGQAPTLRAPVDLNRPVESAAPLGPPVTVTDDALLAPRQLLSVQVDAIEAGPAFTSVRWTLRALDERVSSEPFPTLPPVTGSPPKLSDPRGAAALPVNPSTASGPQLQVGRRSVATTWLTYQLDGRRRVDCLCTGFGMWAKELHRPGGRVSVVTVYPALPRGTRRVDVVLPTATTLWRLQVSPTAAGPRLGPAQTVRVGSWRYRETDPPAGWAAVDWPTPLPDASEVGDYDAFVERLLPSSSR